MLNMPALLTNSGLCAPFETVHNRCFSWVRILVSLPAQSTASVILCFKGLWHGHCLPNIPRQKTGLGVQSDEFAAHFFSSFLLICLPSKLSFTQTRTDCTVCQQVPSCSDLTSAMSRTLNLKLHELFQNSQIPFLIDG